MKIKPHHRNKLEYYLKEFYTYYPEEKHTIFHCVRYFKKRLKNDKDAWCGVVGETGCLSEHTKLYGHKFSIGELYNASKKIIPTISINNNYLVKSKSLIIKTGKKEVYEIELENGSKVYATEDHIFFKKQKKGFVEERTKNLTIQDSLRIYPIHKIKTYWKELAHFDSKIKSIKKVGFIETYDLKTPDYHNFILDNGIVTHNSGKSMFGLMVGILMGRPYDLTKNITYIPKGKEILDKFLTLKRNVFQIDEAAKEMRGVNWHSKSQQSVNTASMTERYLNNMVLLMMPNFGEFTKSMRTGSIIFRFVCVYRTKTYARVIIQRKSRNWRSEDPWGDKAANKLYERMDRKKKEITNEIILNLERSLPNTIMDFIIPNLELILPEVTNEYKRLKLESREVEQTKPTGSLKVESRYKKQYEKLMSVIAKVLYNNELNIGKTRITKSEIAATLNCSVDTFNKYLHTKPADYDTKKPKHHQ